MKLSPVQLIQSHPIKLFVEQNLTYSSDAHDEEEEESVFKFEHMTNIDKAPSEDGRNSYFALIGIRNFDEAKTAPYKYEVVVSGIFSVDISQISPDTNCDDMAAKYSLTMLYGQVRELLAGLTSRMRNGSVTLPTMSFMDATFPKKTEKDEDAAS